MKYFYIIIILLLSSSCSQDENSTNISPIDFNLSIENITSNSAELNWTSAQSENSSSVLYSIHLNDEMISENLDQLNYLLENLNSGELYSVKIIATNEYGNSEVIQGFNTLENTILYLNKYELIDGEVNIVYNSNQDIQELTYTHITESYWNKTISYNYNTENKILIEHGMRDDYVREVATYTYASNNISQIELEEGYVDALLVHDITFYNDLAYTRILHSVDYETTYISTNDVNITKDSNGNLTSLINLNTDNNIETSFSFEYDNNNLVKIIDSENNIFEILYDNYNNFHTYPSGFSNGMVGSNEVASLLYLDYELTEKLRLFPSLFDHINTNNPIEYKINGSTYRSFEYEYNIYGYPTKIITNDIDINLSYD